MIGRRFRPVPQSSWRSQISTQRWPENPRKQLASEAAGNIRQALVNYRRDHSWNATLRAIIYTLVATAILLAIAWAFRKVRLAGRSRFAKWIETRKKDTEGKKTALQVAVNYALSLAVAVGTVIRWLLLIALFQAYATVVLSFYPGSRYISHAINGWILAALDGAGSIRPGVYPQPRRHSRCRCGRKPGDSIDLNDFWRDRERKPGIPRLLS